jgi:hypothetical protein
MARVRGCTGAVVFGGLAAFVGMGAWPTAAHAAGTVSVASVQRAIASAHAGWTAGPTSMSALPEATVKKMLGVPLADVHVPAFHVTAKHPALAAGGLAVPAALDWRNMNGLNYVSPILDQGHCGSCVAFAVIGAAETQLNITAKTTSSPWELSAQYLFSCGGATCDTGWEPDAALSFLQSKGVPDEACLPYTSGAAGTDAVCSTACADVSTRSIKLQSYTPTGFLGFGSVDDVKAALQNGPLVTTMQVYADFLLYKSGIYKHTTGDLLGGHAVSIIGYSDTDQAWIARNNWGTDWGESGFFRVAWSDTSGVGFQTWGLSFAAPGPFVSLSGLRERTVLSGIEGISFQTANLATSAQLTWTLSQGGRTISTGASSDGKSGSFDTSGVADGVYVLTPHAVAAGSSIDGEPRTVYVLNGKESGSIAFQGITEGQKMTGEPALNVTVDAKPVPLTLVTFSIIDASGKVVATRSTWDTGATMQMNWNTVEVPNGSYTIKLEGVAGTQPLTSAVAHVVVAN